MRSADWVRKCLLFGVDRTYRGYHKTDASDPLQKSGPDRFRDEAGTLAALSRQRGHETRGELDDVHRVLAQVTLWDLGAKRRSEQRASN
jgi:hypothetical protein